MKRFFAWLLATLMLLSCLPALAESDDDSYLAEEMGLRFTRDLQDIFNKVDNVAGLSEEGVLSHDPYFCSISVQYVAMEKAAMDATVAEIEAAADLEKQVEMARAVVPLYAYIGEVAVTQLATPEEFLAFAGLNPDEIVEITEFATLDSYHWYYVTLPVDGAIARYDELQAFGADDEAANAGLEKARAEIVLVQAELLKYLKSIEYMTPVDPDSAFMGQVLRFETTDLDGNPVKSEDLFKDNRITMVNLWGTWCPNCINEMAELAAMHTRLQEKGCGIVGIEFEQQPIEEVGKIARGIMTANGTNYPNVLLAEDNEILRSVSAYPTTFFVDSAGRILTIPIIGAAVDKYESAIDKLLAGDTVDAMPDTGAAVNGDNKYFVYVYDTDGKPVEGALVQFCDDVTCSFQPTDAKGAAVFRVSEQKVYEIHLLKVPEGYKENPNVYKTLEVYSNVNIFIEKAE